MKTMNEFDIYKKIMKIYNYISYNNYYVYIKLYNENNKLYIIG